MSLEMLEFKYNGRLMTVEDFDDSVNIEMEDYDMRDLTFWLEKDEAYKLFWWLGEYLKMPMENLED